MTANPIEALEPGMVLIEVERNAEGEVLICTGCGTVETIRSIKARSATAFCCCPERKMVRAADFGHDPRPTPSPDALREALVDHFPYGIRELVERSAQGLPVKSYAGTECACGWCASAGDEHEVREQWAEHVSNALATQPQPSEGWTEKGKQWLADGAPLQPQPSEAARPVVTPAMVDAALHAIVPGGAEVWVWLPQQDAFTPAPVAREVMEVAIRAALTEARAVGLEGGGE